MILLNRKILTLTVTTGIILSALGGTPKALAASTTSKWEEVTGKYTKAKGIGHFGDTRILHTTKANNQYYLQDTTRGVKIVTYDGQNRDDIRPILWRDTDKKFYDAKDAIAVDAHYYAGVVYDYFKEKHGRNSYDNKGGIIRSYVRMGDFADALWAGSGILYGNGNSDDGIQTRGFSSALDLVGHEFTHAIISTSSKLIYKNESGALNEAIADLFGTLIEHDSYNKKLTKKKANWNFAEDVYVDGKTFLRSMNNPASAPLSINSGYREPLIDSEGKIHTHYPDHYSKLYKGTEDHGGVHFNSSIINKASYLLSEGGTHYGVNVQGIGKEKVGKIYYLAATEIFTENTNFKDARLGLEKAAKKLYGDNSKEVKQVQAAYNAVGIK
ncbi:M4 family metallopeptidase [Priestia taiwanensis]|uniref:M4 family metallopeptidase n=1 Tax=Priestia taiwanensis TaxID=1347902 RepID=UPI001E289529|nr:M4 family metallopeptidase [Priestia taiwanensis]MBM7362743.1 Zn-dependent metalloprotease [Priestia taiwanensis]